jgi:hypothetical protein
MALALFVVGLLGTAAGPATRAADRLSASRGRIDEVSHVVEMTIAPGHATLVVQRTVENLGKRHDQAAWLLDVPGTAVATRLRTKGTLDGKPHWFDGDLMEAEAAAAKYKELTGFGGHYPKDPALLSWLWSGQLALQVFPVPPAQRKTVSYTLEMPTVYRKGRHEVSWPWLGLPGSAPDIVVRPRRAEDRIFVGGRPFPSGGLLKPSSAVIEFDLDGEPPPEPQTIALQAADAPPLAGALGVKTFGDNRVLVHYRIEAAPRLGRVPRGAQVVVILDWSRSVPEKVCRAAIAGAVELLRHFGDATAEVLTVDRRVRARHGRLVPVSRAIADLESLEPSRRNGSILDAALTRADQLLAAAVPGRERRVLLLSDLLTRESLNLDNLGGVLRRSGALLHVGRVTATGEPALAVIEHQWSRVARPTGGLAWDAVLSAERRTRDKLYATLEEWARPMRLHQFRVVLPGLTLEPDLGAEAVEVKALDEGEGVAGLQIGDYAPPWMEVLGELWSKPVRVRSPADPGESRLWSALVFGQDTMHELSNPEMIVLARHGRAVSPVTSYLAIEPGVRPSTEGFDEVSEGSLGMGSTFGRAVDVIPAQAAIRPRFDHEAWLREALEPAWRSCGFANRRIALAIETTRDEIVDVPKIEAPPGDYACLSEAVWSLELPGEFLDDHVSYDITLS